MHTWEYRTIKFFAQGPMDPGRIDDVELENVLNEFGARGWELVTIVSGTRRDGELMDFVAVLKREVLS
ncbi:MULTISPECIES: DUF4177 domain-containing protein [unclassified Leptolyngbya]|uniref:DUF4177 domain-containing protein n=1 Tax=unclassified Leptolyngbya TaxID=2650499 RepID=UPI001683D063|nr:MULTISPECIES: DUF4177 domain-containing protein [unclassified Leptolyngbya]MBD2158180.1 DUF4177 domain-containing protein [Leptolyngbya sp. FACHB-16]